MRSPRHPTGTAAPAQAGTIPRLVVVGLGIAGLCAAWLHSLAASRCRDDALAALAFSEQVLQAQICRHRCMVETWANLPEIRQLTAAMQAALEGTDRARDRLATQPQQARLHNLLEQACREGGYQGFSIVSPDNLQIVSSTPAALGHRSLARLDFLAQAMAGAAFVTRPYLAGTPLPDQQGTLRLGVPTMHALAPVRDEAERVVAVLRFRIAPVEFFAPAITGCPGAARQDVCLFDSRGVVVRSASSAGPSRAGRAGVEFVFDATSSAPRGPSGAGGRDPVTAALLRVAGENFDGYADHRGRTVVGAWRWLPELELLLASQAEPPLAPAFRCWTLWTLGVCLATLVAIHMRRREHGPQRKPGDQAGRTATANPRA